MKLQEALRFFEDNRHEEDFSKVLSGIICYSIFSMLYEITRCGFIHSQKTTKDFRLL